jgi:DNA-damage-inducible protein D
LAGTGLNYRHFLGVVEKARLACFNSGHRVEDHFVGTDQMILIGKGGHRPVKTVMESRKAISAKRSR